jgi:predicted nucleic acid-binding protein
VSSIVASVEVLRAAQRVAHDYPEVIDRAEKVIDGVELLWLNSAIASAASRLPPSRLRALDAIHLASGLSLGDDLTAFVVSDLRLQEEAREHRLPVLAPR